jgi:hypothetical protein
MICQRGSAGLEVKRKAETLRRGWPSWLFPNEAGQPMDDSKVRKMFAAGLRPPGSPDTSRPTACVTPSPAYCSRPVKALYVQAQLGHASIRLTVDLYGKWLPKTNKAAVDRLDDGAGSAPVVRTGSYAATAGGRFVQLPETAGAGGGSRTRDLLITNQLLCL